MSQNLSSAAVVIGALRVKLIYGHNGYPLFSFHISGPSLFTVLHDRCYFFYFIYIDNFPLLSIGPVHFRFKGCWLVFFIFIQIIIENSVTPVVLFWLFADVPFLAKS